MRNFRQLDVWKKAHALTLDVYRLTAEFPSTERYGLCSQLKRAAASIEANLAEGCGRETDADFQRFVQISSGSACEVECHLILARDLELISEEAYSKANSQINEVKRMLFGLARFLGKDASKNHPSPVNKSSPKTIH